MSSYFLDAVGARQQMYMAHSLGSADAPLPLTRIEAIERARELNDLGFDWPAVTLSMGYYHGWYLTQGAWRQSVQKWCGDHVRRPRGVPFQKAAA
jgi:hypothetical protein